MSLASIGSGVTLRFTGSQLDTSRRMSFVNGMYWRFSIAPMAILPSAFAREDVMSQKSFAEQSKSPRLGQRATHMVDLTDQCESEGTHVVNLRSGESE